MEQRADLRELPPGSDRLQAHPAEPHPKLVDLAVQHVVLDDIELLAKARRIAADHVGELVDDRIEQRHRRRKLCPCRFVRRVSSIARSGLRRAVIISRCEIAKCTRTRSSPSCMNS